ncbi:hypothetical protein CFP56_024300, partial [Quercus suber]
MKKVRFALLSSDDPFPLKHFSKHFPDTPNRRILMKQAQKRGLVLLNVEDGVLRKWANSPSTSKGRGEHEEKGKTRLGPVLSKQEK